MLSAYAQEITGSISGVATDTTGAAVAGVKITVTNTGTNVSRVVTTGPAGAYRVPFLIFGTYSVTGELQGFKTSRVQNVMLSTSEEARVDLTMAVGDVTETVTVSGSEALLKTEEATIGATINQQMVVDLPLVGRQIIGAALLSPGAYSVSVNSKAQRDSGFVRRNGLSLSVNGLTDLSNKFYYDGIEGMNFDAGSRAFDPSLEAVEEVKVLVNSNSAEYGGAAGASVNIVTKSGTNQFHGHVFDYLQNDKLNSFQTDAKNLRARQIAAGGLVTSNKPTVRNNIFGGGAGGPIKKDRLFFFANYEGTRGRRAGQFAQRTIPTAKMRNGDFSDLITPAKPVLRDPLNGGAPFPDPSNLRSRLDPVSLKVLGLVPAANTAGVVNNFQGPISPASITVDEITSRIDYRIGNNDTSTDAISATSTMISSATSSRCLAPAALTAATNAIATIRT